MQFLDKGFFSCFFYLAKNYIKPKEIVSIFYYKTIRFFFLLKRTICMQFMRVLNKRSILKKTHLFYGCHGNEEASIRRNNWDFRKSHQVWRKQINIIGVEWRTHFKVGTQLMCLGSYKYSRGRKAGPWTPPVGNLCPPPPPQKKKKKKKKKREKNEEEAGSQIRYRWYCLKTLFNIVEERLKKLLNFDVSAVKWCSERSINSQECKSYEIDAVTIKKSMTEYHHWINELAAHLL